MKIRALVFGQPERYDVIHFSSVQAATMKLHFLIVVILTALFHLCQGSYDSYSIPGCSKHCPAGSTKNVLPINGYVLNDVLRMPFNRICESLENQNPKNLQNFTARKLQRNPAFQKIQNQPTQKICQTLFKDLFGGIHKNHDDLYLALQKIQNLSPSLICNTYTPENSRKIPAMRKIEDDSDCTEVCPAGDEIEKKKIHGAFLEYLRRDSLKKICKNLLILHATKMAADAQSSTKWEKFEVRRPQLSLKFGDREMKSLLNEEKRLLKSQKRIREKLSKAMKKLKTAKSNMDAIFARIDVDWAIENLSMNDEDLKEVRERINEEKIRMLMITKKFRLAEERANEAEKKAVEMQNKAKHILESLRKVGE